MVATMTMTALQFSKERSVLLHLYSALSNVQAFNYVTSDTIELQYFTLSIFQSILQNQNSRFKSQIIVIHPSVQIPLATSHFSRDKGQTANSHLNRPAWFCS